MGGHGIRLPAVTPSPASHLVVASEPRAKQSGGEEGPRQTPSRQDAVATQRPSSLRASFERSNLAGRRGQGKHLHARTLPFSSLPVVASEPCERSNLVGKRGQGKHPHARTLPFSSHLVVASEPCKRSNLVGRRGQGKRLRARCCSHSTPLVGASEPRERSNLVGMGGHSIRLPAVTPSPAPFLVVASEPCERSNLVGLGGPQHTPSNRNAITHPPPRRCERTSSEAIWRGKGGTNYNSALRSRQPGFMPLISSIFCRRDPPFNRFSRVMAASAVSATS